MLPWRHSQSLSEHHATQERLTADTAPRPVVLEFLCCWVTAVQLVVSLDLKESTLGALFVQPWCTCLEGQAEKDHLPNIQDSAQFGMKEAAAACMSASFFVMFFW